MAISHRHRVALKGAGLCAALATVALGCKGPDREGRTQAVVLPDQAPLVVQWGDGPRRDNAEREMEKQAQRMAAGLFRAEPMAREVPEDGEAKPEQAPVEAALPERPSWADGVEQPVDDGADQLPQGWPIEVRRGETPAVVAEWAAVDVNELVASNQEALRGRKWFKVGDRITVTMSAADKVRFDRKREQFQKERVGAFFANRYFEKVIVYRVKKGEFVASAAKRYGDVPLWLIEEFNQMDFRGLQPGDEILIPVVGELPAGVRQPPPPVVVDEEGHALTEATSDAIAARLKSDLFAKARMALDDSNVFSRPRAGGEVLSASPEPGLAPGGVAAPMVGAVQGAGYPRPEQALPPASIGGGLLPNYAGGQAVAPRPAAPGQVVQVTAAAPHVAPAVAPAAPEDPAEQQVPRDVIVRRGESLMHYVMWSKTSLDAIKAANQGRIDGDRIFIGARVTIPMSEAQFVQFVTARAAWDKERAEQQVEKAQGGNQDGRKAGSGEKAPKKTASLKQHSVKSGETGTSIARLHRVTVKDLKAANGGVDFKRLRIGQKLSIPKRSK